MGPHPVVNCHHHHWTMPNGNSMKDHLGHRGRVAGLEHWGTFEVAQLMGV